MQPHEAIAAALAESDGPAIVAFLTAGYPAKESFLETLRSVAEAADAVELGVPFSDPMADGVTIQRSSREAIEAGVSLGWILDELQSRDFELGAPVLLMSYLNPLLAFGYDKLAERAAAVGVSGFIVPDLPYEESEPVRAAFDPYGLALVQMVTPATPDARLATLCAASRGFVYAVTQTGITGRDAALPEALAEYLARVKHVADIPVCAGFGVRQAAQVAEIGRHVDGVVVGSALVEVLERGEDPAAFLTALRQGT